MIYLFDKDEKLFKVINKPALKTVLQKYALTTEQYVSDRLTVEMKSLDTDELEKVEYMAIQTVEDAHTFHYFYVAQKYTEQLTTLIGVQSGIEELRKTPVWDKRPKNAFAKNVINDLLKGTNWQARFVGETTQRSTNFYYTSVFEALKKVCKVWNLEMQFFVEMNGNKIGARYIDFKQKIGSAVGKRVVYGHNALQILQEVERTNLFTALIGRGKGEQVSSADESDKKNDGYGRKITFENVVWDVAKGNPVNKPKGQRFVELPEMTKVYGIKNTDGSIRPKIGFVDFQEEEEPGVLLERTYKALVDTARPQLTLKTTSAYLKGVKVGDTIRVVRHDKKLDYDTRIFEITFNRLNNESSDIKLGDRISESNEVKAQTIAEKVVDNFVSNEFSNFVQNLPDFLPSADGFNNNWYGAEDPTVKHPGKVLINDIWFKPDPEHEGHKIMLRWTGEVWDEILRTYDNDSLKKRISEEIANFDKSFQLVNEKNKKKIDEILQSSGASSLLAQEAKKIGLDSVAKLEEFKRWATNAQTALSGDLDGLKRTIANDIRPKQVQAEVEIKKQVEALNRTKNELAGVKSAQATYEETTTRRLSELTNLANGKASKSELTQTAEELSSKIASVQAAHKNQGDRVSVIESNFKQRADALEVGVRSLTEGLRTKADISSLNVTAENIRQSVKRLETNTQDKLNQKLSLAEFEVRAGSIRQEILNATKDKADKTLVIAEAGKLREEFSKMKVGSRNYAEDYDFSRGLWNYSQGDNSPQDWTISNGEYNVKGTTNTWKQMQIHSKEGSRSSWKSSTALLDLEIGETYTLSFQGICYSGSSSVWLSLRANRTVSGNPEIMYGNFNLTSSWQTYQVTIPALTKPDNFDFWRIILGYDNIGHVAFRKVELTRSSTRIDAGPAPEDGKTDLVVAKSEFEKTAEGLSAKMTAVESYVGQDGQRQEALRRYTREESAKQATAVRELVTRDYVGKATYQEDVRGIERRFEAITNPQNGSIATQIAKYKTAVDGRFADITSMISGKANQTDFQRVKETSQLYERILGNSENGITNNVARMALTNQLFQVEVAKHVGSGRNYIKNADFQNSNSNWNELSSTGLYFNYKHSASNRGKPGVHIYGETTSQFYGLQQNFKFEASAGETIAVSFLIAKDGKDTYSGLRLGIHYRKNNENIAQKWVDIQNSKISSDFYKKMSFSFTIPENIDELNLMLFGEHGKAINLYISEVKLERGSFATDFTLSPEDTEESVRTVQSQLAGSWAVQNLTSAGALVSGLNLGANGHNRLDGKLTHITGETLIDKAVIKSAMVDKLKTANFEAGSVTTVVLDAEAVTADKVKMNEAFANKLVASDTFTNTLTAKRGFINQLVSNNIFTSELTAQRGFIHQLVSNNIFTNELTAQRGFIHQLQSKIINTEVLDAFRGRIGGFNLGPFPQGGGRWIAGNNPYICGMGNGEGGGVRTAFWANWGNNWNKAGWGSWVVNTDGKMYCKNEVNFYHKVDFANTCAVNFYSRPNASKGIWTGDGEINGNGSNPAGGQNAVVWWNQITTGKWRQHAGITTASDRRLKENIEPTPVKALDKINDLNLVAFDYIKDKSHEEIGLIAQEVLDVVPNAVNEYEGKDSHLTINYAKFIPYLLKAIQELNKKINLMEERYGSII